TSDITTTLDVTTTSEIITTPEITTTSEIQTEDEDTPGFFILIVIFGLSFSLVLKSQKGERKEKIW
ncbi:MAG: hypothetical protein ACFFCQ_09265, partial [Promethearchaeota archaeon]